MTIERNSAKQEEKSKMKIMDICKELDMTRQGLYYLLQEHSHDEGIAGHVTRDEKGKWTIDTTALETLREIRMKSKRVIVAKTSDEAMNETIRGMELKIRDLNEEIRKLDIIKEQAEMLHDAVADFIKDHPEIDKALQRELLAAVKFYDNNTHDKSIRARIRKEDRAKAKAEKKRKEFEARQMSLFSEV